MKKISINIHPEDKGSLPLVEDIIELANKFYIEVNLPDYDILKSHFSSFITDLKNCYDSDIVIVIGGDGTFIRTARMFCNAEIPIMGINRGRLGFLNEFMPAEALNFLKQVFKGDYLISKRKMMKVDVIRDGEIYQSVDYVNDAVITKGSFSRPIKIKIDVDDMFVTGYSGDGLIIASATGSTAYSLSAGGPIVVPYDESVYIANPVCPHTLAIRPMILPDTMTLSASIENSAENLLLTIDGQEAIELDRSDIIKFYRSKKVIHIIRHPEMNFFKILQTKLGWGNGII